MPWSESLLTALGMRKGTNSLCGRVRDQAETEDTLNLVKGAFKWVINNFCRSVKHLSPLPGRTPPGSLSENVYLRVLMNSWVSTVLPHFLACALYTFQQIWHCFILKSVINGLQRMQQSWQTTSHCRYNTYNRTPPGVSSHASKLQRLCK